MMSFWTGFTLSWDPTKAVFAEHICELFLADAAVCVIFSLKSQITPQKFSNSAQTWTMIILSNCFFLEKEEERTVVARFLIWSCSKLRGSDNWNQVTLIKNPNFFRLGAAHGGEIIYTGTIISEIRPPGICSIWSCNQFYPTFCSSPHPPPFFVTLVTVAVLLLHCLWVVAQSKYGWGSLFRNNPWF